MKATGKPWHLPCSVDVLNVVLSVSEYRVQALRDQWCKNNITAAFTYARFARNEGTGYMWICVTPTAMLKENMCYNISKGSKEYYTRDKSHEILGIN